MATEFKKGPALAQGAPKNERRDAWWLQPAAIFVGLTAFVVYATFRVFENAYYIAGPNKAYLSPFASPDLTGFVPAFLVAIPVVGQFLTYPAFLILPFPAGFRFTCYYYRKSYYRSFVGRPAACAVPATKGIRYLGEKGLLRIQNYHRYFLYFAILIVFILAYEAARSVYTHGGTWNFGIGSVILIVNAVFLAFYTFGCHSFRHLIGGKLDCYSCDAISLKRHNWWTKVTMLNERHMLWAWLSLISVAGADLYIRFLATRPDMTTIFGVPI